MWHLATEDLEGGHRLWPWCMLWQLVCGEVHDWQPRLEVLPDLCCPNRQLIRVHFILLLQSSSLIRRQSHLHFWSYCSVLEASSWICLSGLWWHCTLDLYDSVKKFHITPKVPIELRVLEAGDVVMFRYINGPVDGLMEYKVLQVNPTKKWKPLNVECDCEGECDCFAMLQTDYTTFKVGNVLQFATTLGKLETYFLIERNMKET